MRKFCTDEPRQLCAMVGDTAPSDRAYSAAPASMWESAQQKLALTIIMAQLIGPFIYWPVALFLAYKSTFMMGFMAAYLVYIFVLDNTAHMQPQGSAPIRSFKFWRHLADYFPAKLHKTADLDPSGNYIFAAHPHGVACMSHTANFLTEASGFSKLYPGISLYPLLLDSHFFAPFHREIALRSGFRGISRQSCLNLLTARAGSAVFLVPGGAAEALLSQPGTCDLIMMKRKGIMRVALQTGASLVPVLAFGETSLFDVAEPKPGSFIATCQQLIRRLTGFAIPLIHGEGFWPNAKAFAPLPRALPVHTVVGAPLPVKRWQGSHDSPEFTAAVDALHAEYCQALKALWNTHKEQYAPRPPPGTPVSVLSNGSVCYRRKSLEFVQ
uniref:Acyltransferase n=1 Tax=Haematococcus lacustris TaxID=44745 RepID=A0A7G8Z0G1_HAELA|nr:acyl-CoA: diacylglycerol acyltransferase 2A [Haematococcus lacustris]QNL10740.1 acyl-CoA: diacylglycerol acyltransferase 2-3 [Haematococcus lacustris]